MASRDCYATMGDIPKEVRLAGGAARSAAIRTILASALGAEVRTVSREETGAAGAVMMAAVQQGLYPDMQSCCDVWITPALGEATKPDQGLASTYNTLFPIYRELREGMAKPWRALAELRGR